MPTATTNDTSLRRCLVELAPAVLAAAEPDRLPARPDAAAVDEMLAAVSELGAAVDQVLTYLSSSMHGKQRYAKASRSISLARDCARWMCADISAAVATLDHDRGEPEDQDD